MIIVKKVGPFLYFTFNYTTCKITIVIMLHEAVLLQVSLADIIHSKILSKKEIFKNHGEDYKTDL